MRLLSLLIVALTFLPSCNDSQPVGKTQQVEEKEMAVKVTDQKKDLTRKEKLLRIKEKVDSDKKVAEKGEAPEKNSGEVIKSKPKEVKTQKVVAPKKKLTESTEKVQVTPPAKRPIKSVPKKTTITSSQITFTEMIHEFGEIEEGEKIAHKFMFTNNGSAPLVINDVQVSCGCTAPSYPFVPIEPGESGYIGVLYNSKGKFGTQKPTITVYTNAKGAPAELSLHGRIKDVLAEELPTIKKDTL